MGKAEVGKSQRKRKSQKKEMQLREKVGKPQFTAMICGSRGSKSRLAEAAGAEPWMRDEKLHAVVVRSTFPSQNVQNTSVSEHGS